MVGKIHGFSTGPGQVVAADEKVASEAAAEADGIKKETRCVGSCGELRRGQGGKQDLSQGLVNVP